MKKTIIALTLLIIVSFATTFALPSAVAAPLKSDRTIEVFHPNEDKTVVVGKDLFTFKNFVSKDISRNISLIEITQAPQYRGAFLLEKHVMDDPEDFYVLQGEFEFDGLQPDDTIKVTTGDIVHISAGVPYGIKHVGAEIGKMLVIATNTRLQNLLSEIGTSVTNKSSIPSDSIGSDMEKIASAAKKYGIEFLN